jgi:hypothetical protein
MKSFSIFTPTKSPLNHSPGIGENWLTWSPKFRKTFLRAKKLKGYDLISPELIFLQGFQDYNYSYDVVGTTGPVDQLLAMLEPFAAALYQIEINDSIYFLDKLIDEDISADDLSVILSILRKIIVARYKDKMEALYTPLTATNTGQFPLHCDLYIPKRLLNIYEVVAKDDSGKSIFMPMQTFMEKVLPFVDEMPARTKSEIASIINSNKYEDNYEHFYEILHGRANPWFARLKHLMSLNAVEHKFEKGQGYLLHDRKWLHGRTKPNGTFSVKRVHRLVFNSNY